jgi:hypothetical protein
MANILPALRYIALTIRHKIFVFRAGIATKTPLIQLFMHDLSKFMASELPHYSRQFFGDRADPKGFEQAWLHHQNHNQHHWEYWIPRKAHSQCNGDTQNDVPLMMPERFVREMVADWLGASRAYSGCWPKSLEQWTWLQESRPKMRMHPATERMVDDVLNNYFLYRRRRLGRESDA